MSAVSSGGLTITRLSADDLLDHIEGLAALLVDVVAGGASLGFLTPFGQGAAAAWWRTRQAAMADGSLIVWVAAGPGGVTGTVSLAPESKPNGRHRAEIVKLMVRHEARGRGLARALLATAEDAAVRTGATLLLLDTATGSAADHLYRATGWTQYGIVPGYAADPAGTLEDCSFYYKRVL